MKTTTAPANTTQGPVRVELCPAACAAAALLDQAADFVRDLGDGDLSRPSRVFPEGTIGKHLRHLTDHFAAALSMMDRQGGGAGTIDYDHRERDVPMETCRETALEVLAGLRRQLGRATATVSAREVVVRVMLTSDGRTTDFSSTLGRELAFAAHHAIHHNAMIKAIARELGLRTPEGFGMAPSTVNFLEERER
jgi:uncharacterized damage-inducible protein DinB